MFARSRKQGPCWEQLPASVLGQVARHLRQPGRTAGTETICQVCSSCECHGMPLTCGARWTCWTSDCRGLLQLPAVHASVTLPLGHVVLAQTYLMLQQTHILLCAGVSPGHDCILVCRYLDAPANFKRPSCSNPALLGCLACLLGRALD
jgi:hypothetical protein